MSKLTQPLRDEHAQLLPHLEHVLGLADEIVEGFNPALVNKIGKVHAFLADHLLGHAQAEERALYPVVARVMGAPDATATMSWDHVEIGRLIDELHALRAALAGDTIAAAQARALRRVLYGLYGIVKLHFLKEEEVYLPLLDQRLTPNEAQALIADLEKASHAA